MRRETGADQIEQARAMELFTRGKDYLRVVRTNDRSETDFLVWHKDSTPETLLYLVEVKRRYNRHDLYDTVILEPNKIEFGRMAGAGLMATPLYLILWDDKIGWVDMRVCVPTLEYGGRYDRGEKGDEGMKYFVPLGQFHLEDI